MTAHCSHLWCPMPADAASAIVLVGHTRCLRCNHTATRDDMAAFSKTIRPDDPMGQVVSDYDVMRSSG